MVHHEGAAGILTVGRAIPKQEVITLGWQKVTDNCYPEEGCVHERFRVYTKGGELQNNQELNPTLSSTYKNCSVGLGKR